MLAPSWEWCVCPGAQPLLPSARLLAQAWRVWIVKRSLIAVLSQPTQQNTTYPAGCADRDTSRNLITLIFIRTAMPGKVLLPTFGPSVRVNIHPLVLFSVCDAYIRRSEKQDRVIGTLLGVVSDGIVEVKNCYVVPHNESSDQVCRMRCRFLCWTGPNKLRRA